MSNLEEGDRDAPWPSPGPFRGQHSENNAKRKEEETKHQRIEEVPRNCERGKHSSFMDALCEEDSIIFLEQFSNNSNK